MRENVALIRQYPGAAQRIAVAVARLQHRFIDLDGLDQVLLTVFGGGVDHRVGQVQLHAGPALRMLVTGEHGQRLPQRLRGDTQPQLARRFHHRHGQVGGGEVGMRGRPQHGRVVTPDQLQRGVVVRDRRRQQFGALRGLLMEDSCCIHMQFSAGDPQRIGVVEQAQGPLETLQRGGVLDVAADPGRGTGQHAGQGPAHRSREFGGAVKQQHRRGVVAVSQRRRGLRSQHDRRDLSVVPIELGRGVGAPQGEKHHVDQHGELSEVSADRGGVGLVGIENESVVARDRVVAGQREQGAVPVTGESAAVRLEPIRPLLGKPATDQRGSGGFGVLARRDEQVSGGKAERAQRLRTRGKHDGAGVLGHIGDGVGHGPPTRFIPITVLSGRARRRV